MAVLIRGGVYDDFDKNKLLPREFAVVLENDPDTRDGKAIYICFGPGKVKRISTFEDMRDDLENAAEEIFSQYVTAFNNILNEIKNLKAETEGYKEAVESIRNDIVNIYLPQILDAAKHAENAKKSADDSADSALLSESFARGNTGVRVGENTDNSMFYSNRAADLVAEAERVIASATSGGLIPAGTVKFEDLPTEPQAGFMYNISNDFVTDERFEGGAGIYHTAGNNVYWTKEGKWDVLVGIQTADFVGTKAEMDEKLAKGQLPNGITAYITDDNEDDSEEQVTIEVDSELSKTSENPVMNKVIAAAIENVKNSIPDYTVDDELSELSDNPVMNFIITENIMDIKETLNVLNLFRDFILSGDNKNSYVQIKNIGSTVTEAQKAAIKNGTFKDLYLGNYWVINNIAWVICHFNYWLQTGAAACNEHHVTIMPNDYLGSGAMNSLDTTVGGYPGSEMYTKTMTSIRNTVKSAFPNLVMQHNEYFVNKVTNGRPSGSGIYTAEVELPSQIMLFGSNIITPTAVSGYYPMATTMEKTQLALYRLCPSLLSKRRNYWLRDVISDQEFSAIAVDGRALPILASNSIRIIPVFSIHG